jgi:hypothetical protein
MLGEEGAQYFDNKQGFTAQVLELEADLNDFMKNQYQNLMHS